MRRPAVATGTDAESNAGTKRTKQAALACRDPLDCQKVGGVLLLDGGLATRVEALGGDTEHSLWSAKSLVSNPQVVRQAHRDFFDAGAGVAITASYQAHINGFRELGLGEDEAAAAVRKSVELAREAASEGHIVAGSIGSYGASLHNGAEYTGEFPGMDEERLVEWHRPRARALVEAKCDILACETIPCLLEARALVKLLEELQFPAWISFSCKSGTEVNSGDPFRECAAVAGACEYVVGVGVNCTNPKFVSELVTICREVLPMEKHVIVYPNSGEEWCGETHTWKSGTAVVDEAFVSMAREWASKGADCIGGCCRTTPTTIKMLKDCFAAAA